VRATGAPGVTRPAPHAPLRADTWPQAVLRGAEGMGGEDRRARSAPPIWPAASRGGGAVLQKEPWSATGAARRPYISPSVGIGHHLRYPCAYRLQSSSSSRTRPHTPGRPRSARRPGKASRTHQAILSSAGFQLARSRGRADHAVGEGVAGSASNVAATAPPGSGAAAPVRRDQRQNPGDDLADHFRSSPSNRSSTATGDRRLNSAAHLRLPTATRSAHHPPAGDTQEANSAWTRWVG